MRRRASSRRSTSPLRFEASDWSWVLPLVRRTETEPAWYRRQSDAEKQALAGRFWSEGRLKLEPWLGPRIARREITLHPNTTPVAYDPAMNVMLANGETIAVDVVIFATGYRVDLSRLRFSLRCSTRSSAATDFPQLDEHFQSSARGLFFTNLAATRDFGPFFGFTVGCPTAANVIGPALRQT